MYRKIDFGVEKVLSGDVFRHIHREAYANVVLEGGFTEAAFAGRVRAEPGVALLHGPFDCHANVGATKRGPTILRLPWRGGGPEGAHRVCDPDLLVRLAERDPWEAECAMKEMIQPMAKSETSWPDGLAAQFRLGAAVKISRWAEEQRLAASSVSRGFRDAYQVSPQRFRMEVRTRLAWKRVVRETESLTRIAHECGFSDLAHMSRCVQVMTGRSPSAWRTDTVASMRFEALD